MMNKMFEVAVRTKMRFPFRGSVSVEDLWDLSLTNLDSVYKVLNSEVKQASEDSLLDVKTEENKTLEMQIEIVKYIVGVKQAEKQARVDALQNNKQKQKLMSILANKEDQELLDKTPEQLKEMINQL